MYNDANPRNNDMTTRQQCAILKLMEDTGCQILQENGQRKYGPPPTWVGPAPDKGSEVFVGHLPRDIFEDELVPLFSRIGPIYQLRLMMDFSGTSRGYAFVEYTCPADARKAISQLNNFEIRLRKRIGVVMSKDNCRLFVGKLPKDKSAEEIKEAMSQHTANVVKVIVHPSKAFNSNLKNRGYAFVEYATHRDAAMARRKLLPGKFLLFDSEIQVDWAQPEPEVDPMIMSKVTNLYVRNLYPVFDCEAHLEHLFSFAGRTADGNPLQVLKVKKMDDFAFIHYATRDQAETALQLADEDPFFGHDLSSDGTRLQVVWAKPADLIPKPRRSDSYSFGRHHVLSPRFPTPFQNNRARPIVEQTPTPQFASPYEWRAPVIGGQRQPQIKEEHPFQPMNFSRGMHSNCEWGNQPLAHGCGDRQPPSHSSSIWSSGATMTPYGLTSPAASPHFMSSVMMRAPSPSLSPFSSPNPFHSFQRF